MSEPLLVPILGPVQTTDHGWPYIVFHDRYKQPCSLQMSSLADYETPGTSAVWLGRVDQEQMHLSRENVAALIHALQNWLNHDHIGGPRISES